MTKLIKYAIYILAAYGGCSLLDEAGTRYLRSHRKEIVGKVSDKIEKAMFGRHPDIDNANHIFMYRQFSTENVPVVMSRIQDEIDKYGMVSVADILDIIDDTNGFKRSSSTNYINSKTYWTDASDFVVGITTKWTGERLAYVKALKKPSYIS